ncbi:MAG TPA: HYR domain-containing protein [Vicinamibacterales bacterium]|nr:HYR domain-containing protein [Vicinamibacterales bacterium]
MPLSRNARKIAYARHSLITAALLVAMVVAARRTEVGLLAQQQISAGQNVNMVGGPAALHSGPPLSIEGDPYLQRQNEPSMACSSRSAITCLAGANDYRLVSVPGTQADQVTGDAWLGVFWSHDDGQTWRSTALPGFPQDTSPAGLASPIKGFPATADPTVRAGTNGLFYYTGIAFNPAASTGGTGKSGVMFASLFIDDNNSQDVTAPPRYIRTVITDNGTSGQFLDKPWVAADIPRGGGSCTIPASNGVPAQVVPAGNVYIAYSVFTGSGNNQNSKLLFAKSTNCGQTWSNPIRLDSSVDVSQSATISINPVNGNILVAWRAFATPNNSSPGRIYVARSTNFGSSFGQPVQVASLGLQNASTAFDLSTLPDPSVPNGTMFRMFRTNGYPAMCTDTTGLARIAWAQRGYGPQGDARILVSTSNNGNSWSTPVPVDNYPGRGHQLMPAMACSANTATVLWYDQRDDNAQTLFGPSIFGTIIADPIPPPPAHTIDVRAAQTGSNGQFGGSIKVSRYNFAFDTGLQQLVQLEFNPVNWPLFSGGQLPFLGDYIDLAPAQPFLPPLGNAGWTYNTDPSPVIHATWTDNRDVVPALNDMWANYISPGGCAPANQASIRNQNIYTSRLSKGLNVGAGGSSRLAGSLLRAFAVFAQNATAVQRRFRLQTGMAPGGPASFLPDAPLDHVDADVPPYSSIARTIFVAGTTTAIVKVFEIDASGNPVANGLQSSTIVNSDATAPPPADGSVANNEFHTLALSQAFVNTYQNPTFVNPTFVNPTFLNPTFVNPTFLNPTFVNPTFVNPTFLNPTFLNPTFLNPTFVNQPLVTDVSWQLTNTGNVDSGYNFSAILAAVPADATFQLLVNRVYSTPGVSGCDLGQQQNAATLVNISNPSLTLQNGLSSSASNASFTLGANDMAVVTLRVINNAPFVPDSITVVATAQASNTSGGLPQVIIDHAPPAITVPATVTIQAAGPGGATGTYSGVSAFDGLDGVVPVSCTPPSGTALPIGDTTITCTATDAHGNVGTQTFTVHIVDTTPPTIGPHADVTVEATSSAGAAVSYAAPGTSDAVDGPGTASCSPSSGSVFAVGNTAVTCTAADAHGNLAVPTTFVVHVLDTTAAALTLPSPITVNAPNSSGAVVNFVATSSDIVDGSLPVTCTPPSGSLFAGGTTTVNCTATDSHGNVASGSFTVTVNLPLPPLTYGFVGVLNLPPPAGKKFNAGSSVPLQFRFTVNGVVINSFDADPQIRITGPTGNLIFTPEDPGSSSFQPPTAANGYTWQFNWQGTGLPAGTYQVYVGSLKTGQTFAAGTAFGPFTVVLK